MTPGSIVGSPCEGDSFRAHQRQSRDHGASSEMAGPRESRQIITKQRRIAKPEDENNEIGRAQSELQPLMRISYAVFCLKKKTSHTLNQRLAHPQQHTQTYYAHTNHSNRH